MFDSVYVFGVKVVQNNCHSGLIDSKNLCWNKHLFVTRFVQVVLLLPPQVGTRLNTAPHYQNSESETDFFETSLFKNFARRKTKFQHGLYLFS